MSTVIESRLTDAQESVLTQLSEQGDSWVASQIRAKWSVGDTFMYDRNSLVFRKIGYLIDEGNARAVMLRKTLTQRQHDNRR